MAANPRRSIVGKPLFVLAALGVLVGLIAAYYYGIQKSAEPPVYNPASNPFAHGIYAQGILESAQGHGANINMFPEVGGTVVRIFAQEGDKVKEGDPIVQLDTSIQQANVAQLKAQSEAAAAVLAELKAQPRKEVLDVALAQVEAAQASVKNAGDQLHKIVRSYKINPRSVSRNDLDNAVNTHKIARTNLGVAEKQYELTLAGAWIYDIQNQERQLAALTRQYESASALLAKYTLKAPSDGVILAIQTAVGSYVSGQGVYDTYTQGLNPVVVMGASENFLQLRVYVDEILVHRLPPPEQMQGKMFIRGTDINLPLEYVRTQPYVSPKIQLSDQRQERVDVRVLPLIFRFPRPKEVNMYPGQLVDVYLGGQETEVLSSRTQLPGQNPTVMPSAAAVKKRP